MTRPKSPRLPRLGKPRPSDVSAGLVTGLFSIPEGMAYAAIGGFNPVAGIYAGVVPTVLGSLFARTVLMVTTLTSALALTSQSAIKEAGLDAKDVGNVATLAVLAGTVMLLMGVLRLGVVMSFVSNAVMTGFSTGIALQIITGSLKDATGYKPGPHNKLAQLADWVWHIGDWQLAATLTALVTVAAWALLRIVKRLEAVATLIALLAVSVGVAVLGTHVDLARDIGHIPAALPSFTAPDLSAVGALLPGAFAVALVGLAQAASIGPTVPNPDGSKSSVNGDFVAQGLGNLGGGLFGALPTGGSMSRTGVAVGAGARTRWTGIFAGLWLALLVLTLGSLAERIPMPVIGALIIVIGCELIVGRLPDIRLVLRTSPLSAAAMVITFLATTQLPLQQAIVIGAVLSLLLFCVQAARQTRLVSLHRDTDGGHWRTGDPPRTLPPGEVTVLDYAGTSLFAELPRVEAKLPDVHGARDAVLVLVVRTLPDVPSSAVVKFLDRYARSVGDEGGRLVLAGVQPPLARLLEVSGLAERLGEGGVVPAQPEIFAPVERAVAEGRAWITSHEKAPDGSREDRSEPAGPRPPAADQPP
ncbi:SulP family inorganic anion transporter [Streptomyces sp. NBC_00006]|uniref:SulP family inorganic anion transporter n=1 Tax=Streptomyces sp. NBC_00006 TaxID=2975619 RepID=UPI0022537D5C|nr:SulP family inorganic anion transporter [Streptomyces sp. NBC_00006]MCX5529448.1 SulP family inorganic anion transporter [Streptomyces sp. NBC_00006]